MLVQGLVDVVVPVFAVVFVGWLLARGGGFNVDGISRLLLYISVPALALDTLTRYRPAPSELGRIALAAAAVMTGVALLSLAASKLLRLPVRGVILTTSFMNAGNFGMSFALLAWGEQGLAYAIMYYVGMAITHNSLGIWLARGGMSGWREMFRVPLLYAALAGLWLAWTDTRLPGFIAEPIHMLAQTAIPLMLLSLGYALFGIKPGALRPAAVATLLRLGGGFALAVLYVELVGVTGMPRNVIVLSSSMPAAVLNIVLAQRYRADPEVVASTVLLTTLVSLVTIPAVLVFLGGV